MTFLTTCIFFPLIQEASELLGIELEVLGVFRVKKRENRKRKTIQWIGFSIIILALIVNLLLYMTGISRNLSISTLDGMKWIGIGVGSVVVLASYLIPETK